MKTLPLIAVLCALAFAGCASLDRHERSLLQEHGVVGALYEKMMHGEPLELPEIIKLSHKGVPTPFIIHYLRDTYYVYNLKSSDVQELERAGVAREVIDYLMATPGMYAPRNPPYPYGPYGPYADPYGYPYGNYGYGVDGPSPYFYPGYRYRRW